MVTVAVDAHWFHAAATALACALACWPAAPARHRLIALIPRARDVGGPVAALVRRLGFAARPTWVPLVGVAVCGGILGGPGGAVAAALATGVGLHRRRAGALRRRRGEETAALLDAVAVMVGELRAGAHPSAAADAVGHGPRAVHRVLAAVAAGARLGADVPGLLGRHAAAEPVIADELGRMAAAWALAERHGAALAELMDAVRVDLLARVRLSGQIDAQLAGPRASASVLAGLPLLGVAMGQGIGADPWHVLTATPIGQVLLMVGTALAGAGMVWSGRITTRAVS